MTPMTSRSLNVGGSGRSCMYQAHIIGTASFMISEGWKRMKPTSSQRCAPLPMWPVTATTTSSKHADRRRRWVRTAADTAGSRACASASMAVTAMAMLAEVMLDHLDVLTGGAVHHQDADAHDDARARRSTARPARARAGCGCPRSACGGCARVRIHRRSWALPLTSAHAGGSTCRRAAARSAAPITGASQRLKVVTGIAGGAIDPEQHELIARQQREDGQATATRPRIPAAAAADASPMPPSA